MQCRDMVYSQKASSVFEVNFQDTSRLLNIFQESDVRLKMLLKLPVMY